MEFTGTGENQALRVPDHVQPADREGREDLTSWQIVTIDGPDAKDLMMRFPLTEEDDGYTLGAHCGCFQLCAGAFGAGPRGPEARDFRLSGGSCHTDAA